MAIDTVSAPPRTPTASVAPDLWQRVLPTLAVLLAFLPLLYLHALSLWDRPHYQFFPFVLAGSAALAWSRWREVCSLNPGDRTLTLAGLAAAWALLALAEVLLFAGLAAVAFLVLLAVLLYGVGGWPLFRALLPAWGFLWLAVHLPFGLDGRLVRGMQALASSWSSAVLDTLGTYHVLAGNVVEIGSQHLLVEEACAGLNSLFSVLACTLFLILWQSRPWFRSTLLLAASLLWVLVANVSRIVVVVLAAERWQLDLSLGLKHDLLGLACFATAVLLIWSTDRLFLFFLPRWAEAPAAASPSVASPSGAPQTAGAALHSLPRLLSWPVAAAFVSLPLLHLALHGLDASEVPTDRSVLASMAHIDRDTLPRTLEGWKQEHYYMENRPQRSDNGEFSKIWLYRLDHHKAAVSLDYPFPDFHLLTVCYEGRGWSIEKLTEHRADTTGEVPGHWIEARLKKPGYRSGYLLYCAYNPRSEVLTLDTAQATGVRSTLARYEKAFATLGKRLSGNAEPPPLRGPAYQFQVFVEGNAPPTAQEQVLIQRLFFQAVKTLREPLFAAP